VKDLKKLLLRRHSCARCTQEKEVVDFFFNWRYASGLYRLCEDCLNEMKLVFPPKKERAFFENIRDAIRITKQYFTRNAT